MTGYTVLTVENGTDSLLILKSHDGPMHLLLTNVVISEMNGRELFNMVAKKHQNIKMC
jgi:response regulator RpfG family c-di-GMP phosphodiesterase